MKANKLRLRLCICVAQILCCRKYIDPCSRWLPLNVAPLGNLQYYELTLPHRRNYNSSAARHPIFFIANPKLVSAAAGPHNLIKRMARAIPVMAVHLQPSKLLRRNQIYKTLVENSVSVSWSVRGSQISANTVTHLKNQNG